jgi:S-adenosylmethionine-diacylglycerol 3-amino-3-carboxypropyl transferase
VIATTAPSPSSVEFRRTRAARSPLQFAATREDPRLEEHLLDQLGPGSKRVFSITGAGCKLLQLATRPDVASLVGADVDPTQTCWARFKLQASRVLSRKDFCRAVGISHVEPQSREALIGRVAQALSAEDRALLKTHGSFFAGGAFDEGTFERLFACWRAFLERFVASREQIQRFFEGDRGTAEAMIASDLWPVSFELLFHQSLLQALFGADAVQHAPPGSYPRYFRARFEWALAQADAPKNPYLSHLLRGRYGALDRCEALPDYLLPERYALLEQSAGKVVCETADLAGALALHPGPYDLIELSNILDWSSQAETRALAAPVLEHLAPGGFLLVRQLNNVRPLPTSWVKGLDFDPALERALHSFDRSFFYSAVRVGRKA